jgi:hypothetical protein
MPLISKSTFLQFQMCPKDTWLKLHKPELVAQFEPTEFELHLMEQGNEVEAVARQLWPNAVLVTATGETAVRETERLMAVGVPIFQATFVADGFLVKCDVLVPNAAAGAWDLYEIKGTNSKKEGNEDRDHISDLAFQTIVLEKAGVKTGRLFIVHLNKEYVRSGALDIEMLFIKDDSTEQVDEARAEINEQMQAAKQYLNREDEPGVGCDCHLKGRSRHCCTFAYSHPEIPEYGVHDIVRIGSSKKRLAYFMDGQIFRLEDVPDEYELGEAQANQVRAHKQGRPLIDEDGIREAIAGYSYPLYFFDYETFAPAIPAFDGYSPYQRIPFQFSLHVLRSPDAELEHIEFLHEEKSDPTSRVADLLSSSIAPGGSVVVWYAPFELGVNAEIGKRSLAHARVIERIIAQIVDLRDVFAQQHYVHPDFRGSTSIKAVLPVLVPELSYKTLAIQEGGTASEQWWKMVAPETSSNERAAIAAALREYCKLDTYAMYAIWKKLQEVATLETTAQ